MGRCSLRKRQLDFSTYLLQAILFIYQGVWLGVSMGQFLYHCIDIILTIYVVGMDLGECFLSCQASAS